MIPLSCTTLTLLDRSYIFDMKIVIRVSDEKMSGSHILPNIHFNNLNFWSWEIRAILEVDILGFKMNLSPSHHCFWELSTPRNRNFWFFPHFSYLVMPPGPGPTSTTWHPARDPPDLATLSSSRGSNIKFWESRFWAWTMDIKLRPSSHSHFPTLIL